MKMLTVLLLITAATLAQAQSPTLSGTNNFTGTNTFPNTNNSIYVDGTKYGFTGTGFAQAIGDCIASSACPGVDARGISVPITLASTINITKRMFVLLPPVVINCPSTGGAFVVASGISDVWLLGDGRSGNLTQFQCGASAAVDVIRFNQDAGYGRVEDVYFNLTGTDVQNVGIHALDIVGFSYKRIIAHYGGNSIAGGNQITGIKIEVTHTGQVPERGYGLIEDFIQNGNDSVTGPAGTNSTGVWLKGISGTNGTLKYITVQGSCNIENVEAAFRIDTVQKFVLSAPCFMQADIRSFLLTSAAENIFMNMRSSASGFTGFQEHINVDSASADNWFLNPSYTPNATIGTDNGQRTLILGGGSGFPDHGIWDFRGTDLQVNNLNVQGTLTKHAGGFRIDHPLDPAHKYLQHSFVESPDMMDIYNGIVRLDAKGEANVQLPSYFEALNSDFRYQLTSIGVYSPIYVAKKIKGNSFRIAGGHPGQEVSWQVTGVRQDDYAKAHRIVVEENKSDSKE